MGGEREKGRERENRLGERYTGRKREIEREKEIEREDVYLFSDKRGSGGGFLHTACPACSHPS